MVRAVSGPDGERAAIGQRQEVLHGPLEHLQAVLDQPQVVDHLGVQQADRVARGGVAEAGVEFLGDGGAAEYASDARIRPPESPALAR